MQKFIYAIFAVALIIAIPASAQKNEKPQEDPRYVLFDNFDNWANEAFWTPIQELTDYAPYFEKRAFSSSINITDYDVAIFPMGNSSLDPVIGKIREMIAADKHVLIVGRNLISNPGGSDSRDLLENTLGINYFERIQTPMGNSSFLQQGSRSDPVGYGFRLYCNADWTWVGVSASPLAYVTSIETFNTKDWEEYPPTFHYWYDLSDATFGMAYDCDTLTGVRKQVGKSKIALWSVGFEVICGQTSRENILRAALNWCTFDADAPEPIFDTAENLVYFGKNEIDETSIREIPLTNLGGKDLIISEMLFDPLWNDDEAFKFVEGSETPITIGPGEFHIVKVSFTPRQEMHYDGMLKLVTNNYNVDGAEVPIWLGGDCGVKAGPNIETDLEDDPQVIDFGDVEAGLNDVAEFGLWNKGDTEMFIHNLEIDKGDENAFFVLEGNSYPYYVKPNEYRPMKVRFSPGTVGKSYTGSITIFSNATNDAEFKIDFVGKGVEIGTNEAQISVENDAIDFGNVAIGDNSSEEVVVENTGNAPLVLSNVRFDPTNTTVFSFLENSDATQVINPDNTHAVKIMFAPEENDVVYEADLLIESTAVNEPSLRIPLSGIGGTDLSVPAQTSSDSGLLTLRALPNPFTDETTIELELSGSAARRVEIAVYDVSGAKVLSLLRGDLAPGVKPIRVSSREFNSGTYFVVAETGDERVSLPIFILR